MMPQIALLLTTLIWGATFPATKAVLEQLPPLTFLFVRFFMGTVLALGIMLACKGRLRIDQPLLRMGAVATVFLFLGYITQTIGLRYTTASNSAFITALYVVFVPLFLGRFDARIWIAAGLALVGLWLLVNPTVSLNLGDLLSLACAVAFAVHISCLESFVRRGDGLSLFVLQMVLVTVLMAPAAMLEGPEMRQLAPTPLLSAALLITGGLATGAFAVQMWAQKLVPAQRVALIFSLEPAFAAWLAWYFLGEHLDFGGWLGSGLILTAVIIGALAPATGRVEAPASLTPGLAPIAAPASEEN